MDSPSLLWYLSEIVIEPILNKKEFQNIFNHKFTSYENFYDIKLNDALLIDTINEIFEKNNLTEAIIKSYNYLLENEKEFRFLCNDNSHVQSKEYILNGNVKK